MRVYVGDVAHIQVRHINAYLNKPKVRAEIGVDPAAPANFTVTAPSVKARFDANLDHLFPTQYYIGGLLERGVRVLIYVGANDWICNWVSICPSRQANGVDDSPQVGNERMTLNLEWTGQEQFINQPLREWSVNDRAAGLTRAAQGFTFATVYGGGHLVSNLICSTLAVVDGGLRHLMTSLKRLWRCSGSGFRMKTSK